MQYKEVESTSQATKEFEDKYENRYKVERDSGNIFDVWELKDSAWFLMGKTRAKSYLHALCKIEEQAIYDTVRQENYDYED